MIAVYIFSALLAFVVFLVFVKLSTDLVAHVTLGVGNTFWTAMLAMLLLIVDAALGYWAFATLVFMLKSFMDP